MGFSQLEVLAKGDMCKNPTENTGRTEDWSLCNGIMLSGIKIGPAVLGEQP